MTARADLRALATAPATGRLEGLGLSPPAAAAKADLLQRAARALLAAGADEAGQPRAFFVPGRVELLGKHTDYAGGRSIVTATERGVCFLALPRRDATVHAFALDLNQQCRFDISPDLTPAAGHWSNYPMTVARRLARNYPGGLRGATLAFAGDLPPAAGMSSSSVLVVGSFLLLAAVNDLADREEYRREITDAESLAGYLGTVENGQSFGSLAGDKGVGTFGGSEDHVAILCSLPGRLSQYSYCPVRLERRLELPPGCRLAVASSGVVAAKTGEAMDKYNRVSRLAAAVIDAWNRSTGRSDPHMAAALAAGDLIEQADRVRDVLEAQPAGGKYTPRELLARFEQFLAESEQIIPAAGDVLARRGEVLAGDDGLTVLGGIVDRSQELAETLLGNQIAETAFLARAARELGAAAASSFGAGFGGSVWALIREDNASDLLSAWAERYAQAFPAASEQATFFTTRPGPAAAELTSGR